MPDLSPNEQRAVDAARAWHGTPMPEPMCALDNAIRLTVAIEDETRGFALGFYSRQPEIDRLLAALKHARIGCYCDEEARDWQCERCEASRLEIDAALKEDA